MKKESIKFTFTDCKDGRILVRTKQSNGLMKRHLDAIKFWLDNVYEKLEETGIVEHVKNEGE